MLLQLASWLTNHFIIRESEEKPVVCVKRMALILVLTILPGADLPESMPVGLDCRKRKNYVMWSLPSKKN